MNQLRYAFRRLTRNPGLTLVAVLTLSLGIGATSTVFCWAQATLLRPFPGVKDPGRWVVLCGANAGRMIDTVSLPNLKDYRALTNVFEDVLGSQITPACLRLEGRVVWAYGQITTANFFHALGIQPRLGRFFLPEEDRAAGGAPVLVLSHGFWQRAFGADPGVIGRGVELNRHTFTVIGVAPEEFRGTMSGLSQDFWAPLVMHREVAHFGDLENRGDSWLHTMGRLRPGVSLARAQAAVDTRSHQLEAAYPATNREMGVRVLPPYRSPWGGQSFFLPVVQVLMAVSFGVLLIVAANVANLLLAQAIGRQKEMAIRLAVGAGRRHLLRQLLTESLVLAALGGLGGILLAHWGARSFELFLPPTYLPVGYVFRIDAGTLLFTTGVTLLTGLLFGLAPGWQALKTSFHDQLKEGGRSGTVSAPHLRLRSALVVSEIALALILLSGAGLCLKGFERAQTLDPGFDPRGLMVAGLRLGAHGYTEDTARTFYGKLHNRLRTTPGVQAAALASWFPLGFEGGSGTSMIPEGYQRAPNEDLGASYATVSPEYFKTMGISILDGRDFTDRDDTESEQVAVVNEAAAERCWPGRSALGQRFEAWGGRRLTVVGVVKTGKYRKLDEAARLFFFVPYRQRIPDLNLGVVIRGGGDPAVQAGALGNAVREIDSAVELWTTIPYRDFMQAAFVAQRIAATLLAALGIVAAGLAALGIYGVMAYVVGQRTHEIGIRMALGADGRKVTRLILTSGARLAGLGLITGLLGALLLSRLLSSFLQGVSPYDPKTFGTVAVLVAGVCLVACGLPALRAARVHPMVALREA